MSKTSSVYVGIKGNSGANFGRGAFPVRTWYTYLFGTISWFGTK